MAAYLVLERNLIQKNFYAAFLFCNKKMRDRKWIYILLCRVFECLSGNTERLKEIKSGAFRDLKLKKSVLKGLHKPFLCA